MCRHCPVFDHAAHLERAWELYEMEPAEPARPGSLASNHPDSYENVQGRLGEIAVCRALSGAGVPHLDGVYLPWGKDGYTQIDHIALVGSTFVVVETKNWKGSMTRDVDGTGIYRVTRNARMPLGDPTMQNEVHVQALRGFLPGATVAGIVVLPSLREYQKHDDHLPEGYTRLPELVSDVLELGKGSEPSAASLSDWEVLEAFHTDEDYVAAARLRHGSRYNPKGLDPEVVKAWNEERAARLLVANHVYKGGPPPPFKNPFLD